MSGMSYDQTIAELRTQSQRQREALEQIVERCEAVNYPPDLVVEIATLARRGLGQTPPGRASGWDRRQGHDEARP